MKPFPRGLYHAPAASIKDAGHGGDLSPKPQPRSQEDAAKVPEKQGEGSRTFDPRSETNIKTLLPKAQLKAREFLAAVLDAGITAKIICGTRTYEEQDLLYAQGRTRAGNIVTKARGGYSWHNFGIAWDIGIFEGDKYAPESPLYARCGAIGKQIGLEWGGDWKFKDEPHFQLKLDFDLAEARRRVLSKESLV